MGGRGRGGGRDEADKGAVPAVAFIGCLETTTEIIKPREEGRERGREGGRSVRKRNNEGSETKIAGGLLVSTPSSFLQSVPSSIPPSFFLLKDVQLRRVTIFPALIPRLSHCLVRCLNPYLQI